MPLPGLWICLVWPWPLTFCILVVVSCCDMCQPCLVKVCWTVLRFGRKWFLQCSLARWTLIFGHLTPKVDHFMPFPRGPLASFCTEISYLFVFKILCSQVSQRTDNRQVANWQRHRKRKDEIKIKSENILYPTGLAEWSSQISQCQQVVKWRTVKTVTCRTVTWAWSKWTVTIT